MANFTDDIFDAFDEVPEESTLPIPANIQIKQEKDDDATASNNKRLCILSRFF